MKGLKLKFHLHDSRGILSGMILQSISVNHYANKLLQVSVNHQMMSNIQQLFAKTVFTVCNVAGMHYFGT